MCCLGLAWIELHVLNPTNRPSPLSIEDLSDELTIDSLIDLIHIVEQKSSSSTDLTNGDRQLNLTHFFKLFSFSPIDLSENILRCHVWARSSQPEIDSIVMSTTLLQVFTFALADYVTEYKLLPTLYNNPRHGSLEPPSSPRPINTGKFSDESGNDD